MFLRIFKKFTAHYNELKMNDSVERLLKEAMQVDDKETEVISKPLKLDVFVCEFKQFFSYLRYKSCWLSTT
jgi:hypothetical protein